jgi:electron transfer flavoprotein alpha subunit
MGQIVVVGECLNGRLTDASQELLTRARELSSAQGGSVLVIGFGDEAREALKSADADEAVAVSGASVGTYNPEAYEGALMAILQENPPELVLLGNTTMGMDLGAALAARLNAPAVAYCTDLALDGGAMVATSQIYGGKLHAEVEVPAGAIVTVIPGSWPASGAAGTPAVRDMTAPEAKTKVLKVIEAESGGDVDITRADILVSVGRGIEDPDNLEMADELAEAVGGVVSCSRPVVDAGWLPRSRQVGKSGQTVKPKVYLALGISGAPEHLQGMKDAEIIIAVNSDENAPIFEVAHYGATADILDLMPALTEKLQGRAG